MVDFLVVFVRKFGVFDLEAHKMQNLNTMDLYIVCFMQHNQRLHLLQLY